MPPEQLLLRVSTWTELRLLLLLLTLASPGYADHASFKAQEVTDKEHGGWLDRFDVAEVNERRALES